MNYQKEEEKEREKIIKNKTDIFRGLNQTITKECQYQLNPYQNNQ